MGRRRYDPDRKKVLDALRMERTREEVRKQGVVVQPSVASMYGGDNWNVRIAESPGRAWFNAFSNANVEIVPPKAHHAFFVGDGAATPRVAAESVILRSETLEDVDWGPASVDVEVAAEPAAVFRDGEAETEPEETPPPPEPPLAAGTVDRVERSFALAKLCRIPEEFIEDAMGDVLESVAEGRVDPQEYRRLIFSWLVRLIWLAIAAAWARHVRKLPRAK